MRIFKFGGASIKDASAIKKVVSIVQSYQEEKPLLVVSASGKTTNALELVVNNYYHKNGDAFAALQVVKDKHYKLLDELFGGDKSLPIYAEIHDLFIDVEWIIEEEPQNDYDYLYDQIVSLGEFLSTKIVAAYLNYSNVPTSWLDVRDCILTDNTYRDAAVQWDETEKRIKKAVQPLHEKGLIITQGFIGVTTENFTTTLGREGSDYTAAIFSYCLDADNMSIWKDVPGVLTADPRIFPDAIKLDHISYAEAIEMTYYGAQVIHPKTIRPLQNKNIPLYVKSFVNPEGVGTIVQDAKNEFDYPPVIVVKRKQAMLKLSSKDFYFVDENRFAKLFEQLASFRIKVNMTQNTALSFVVCINDDKERISRFIKAVEEDYTIEKVEDLKLVTLRHSTDTMVDYFTENRSILLEEIIRKTVQLVMPEGEIINEYKY